MISKPLVAFGNRVFLCTAEANETTNPTDISYKIGSNGLYQGGVFFYTKGIVKYTVLETGEQIPDRTAGWLSTEHQDSSVAATATSGTFAGLLVESSEWLCIPKAQNPQGISSVTSLVLEATALHNFFEGSNIYLVRGTLSIKGKLFVGPCEIRVRSGNVIAESMDKTYSLIFP